MAEHLVELYVAQGDRSTARLHAQRAELAGADDLIQGQCAGSLVSAHLRH